ncbi:LysM peptidoglycan-binding domain-containing protein [Bacillus sp. DNRA2]|uniref:cell division suppressor protein YneA n=1 Tax=Bacillus sp. DNRA2 TaxID=2723053 RepID=UPI00145C7860|nr:LysM peptidoglycan-binding domain-containing protein [Bacillus sp. DNRA2]NMD69574.1 LysM peptidoglycan-binding domain-containing protein [Bacillus sp. DNRA2]
MKLIWKRYSYVIVLIAVSYLAIFAIIHKLDKTDEFINITVQEGESLWVIAEKYSDSHDMTEEEFVHWVQAENGLSEDAIYPGDQLMIPVQDKFTSSDVTVLAGE